MKKAIVIFTTIFAIMVMMMGCTPITNTPPMSIQSEPKPEPLLRFVDETGTREWKIISIRKEHKKGIFEEGPIGEKPEFQGIFDYDKLPWTEYGDYENDDFYFKSPKDSFGHICINNLSTKFINLDEKDENDQCVVVSIYKGNVRDQFRKLFGLSL